MQQQVKADASTWRRASHIVMENDITEIKTQGAIMAASVKAMSDTLKGLGTWMPKVDSTITNIQKSIDEMATRVEALEAAQLDDNTRRPHGHRKPNIPQGPDSDAFPAPDRNNSPVNFELGEHSGKDYEPDHVGHTPHSTYRGNSSSRMPKTDFPRFDGENPKWWKGYIQR